jgi:hypothetical protein
MINSDPREGLGYGRPGRNRRYIDSNMSRRRPLKYIPCQNAGVRFPRLGDRQRGTPRKKGEEGHSSNLYGDIIRANILQISKMEGGYGWGFGRKCDNCGPPLPPVRIETVPAFIIGLSDGGKAANFGQESGKYGKMRDTKSLVPYSAKVGLKDLGRKLTLGHGGHLEDGSGWSYPGEIVIDRLYLSGPDKTSVDLIVGEKTVASGVIVGGKVDMGVKWNAPAGTTIKTTILSVETGEISGALIFSF